MNRLADDINELFLDELRSNFEAGDGIQLLTAVRFCGRNNLPLPEWVVTGLCTALDKWYTLQSRTIDEALGLPAPQTNGSGDTMRKRRREQVTVYNRVVEMQKSGLIVDDILFKDVGSRFGISGERAAEYYYTVKRFFHPTSVPEAIERLLETYALGNQASTG